MYVMTLKEKVFFYRNKYRKEKIFEINNFDLNKKERPMWGALKIYKGVCIFLEKYFFF